MFIQSYINTAKEILEKYSGNEPFSSFLKKFFKEHKKFGSRDRKQIAQLCYCFFRLGKSLQENTVEERFAIAIYICTDRSSQLLEILHPEWNKTITANIEEKIKNVEGQYAFNINEAFPWKEELTNIIDYNTFIKSFFIQPDIYLRLRPAREMVVQQKLSQAQIPFQIKNEECVSVAPATRLDDILEINKEVVIQDMNSQSVINPLLQHVSGRDDIKTGWDCCAASGGKSILLHDKLPGIQLTVSDIRESILVNLVKRFSEAGITNYRKMVADLAAHPLKTSQKFDVIVCDAPCSGSGTWSRTPEQLYFFEEEKINYYSALQKEIVNNAVNNLRRGGYFLYITCSVFKKENEEIVSFIQENLALKLLEKHYFSGYNQKADTLFAALFIL